MYDAYIRTYKHYVQTYGPNTAVLLLVGAFYELYDILDKDTGEPQTSMKRAVEIMGIQLKEKKGDAPGGRDGYFAGFGEEQLHKFSSLLTRENWTVVVCNQERDQRGKVQKERPVARILSPGTHVEANSSDAFYLGALWLEPEAWGTAAAAEGSHPPSFSAVAVDLTTGGVMTYEARAQGRRDTWNSDELLHFFQVHPPREIVVWWRGHALDCPSESTLRRTLGVPTALLHIRQASTLGAPMEKALVREDLLRRCFQPKSLLPLRESLGLTDRPLTEKGVCATLLFIEDHFPSAMDHLHLPRPWNPREAVTLGNHALTQLNMITTREEDSVLAIFSKTYTAMGRRGMRQRLLFPGCVPEVLNRRYDEIAWWRQLAPERAEAAVAVLRQIQDLARLHRKLGTGAVNVHDILALDQSYTCALRLAAALEASPQAMAPELQAAFAAFRASFATTFSVEKALAAAGAPSESAGEVFCLQPAAGPAVAAVEAEIASTRTEMLALYEEAVQWFGETTDTLRLDYKEASVLLAGSKGMMTRAQTKLRTATPPTSLAGIVVHAKKSSSSMEVPAIARLFQKILRLREELRKAVRTELPVACDALAEAHTATWDALERWVTDADIAATLARVSKERNLCRPTLIASAGGSVRVQGLRHPLIEGQQTRTEYVRHNVELGAEEEELGWLVYGMNASGKSSLMKALGIAVLLAQCGCYVPASAFHLSPFSAIYTRILNTDNLWAGLSSFAVEMTELREILERANERSLVLGDEVCSGTESESATALVAATLAHFQDRGVRYIFATHLHGLQAVPQVQELRGLKVWHLRVRYDAGADRLVYERTLHPGAGSSLYGLEVAKAMGLPATVLERARRIRRAIAGTATEEEAPQSSWNAAVQRRACECCGAEIVRDLEVHHVDPRAGAVGGRLADGSSMNSLRNLAVVCQGCHDRHHAGELQIGAVQQTSDGPVRQVVDLSQLQQFAYTPSAAAAARRTTATGLTADQQRTVEEYLRRYPALPATRLVFDLAEREGITITPARLRTIRAQLA